MLTRSRLRTLEAAAALVACGLLLRIVPFAFIARLAGITEPGGQEHVSLPLTRDPRAAVVGRAVNRAAGRLPWQSGCLVRALAGRVMLARRRVPSILVLGVAMQSGEVTAHAWLIAGDGTVCGGREAPNFSPIVAFRTGQRPSFRSGRKACRR